MLELLKHNLGIGISGRARTVVCSTAIVPANPSLVSVAPRGRVFVQITPRQQFPKARIELHNVSSHAPQPSHASQAGRRLESLGIMSGKL